MKQFISRLILFAILLTPVLALQAQPIDPSDPAGWVFTHFGTEPTMLNTEQGWYVEINDPNSKSILVPPLVDVPLADVFPLQYEVEKLTGPASTTWYVNLYIDVNGDGNCNKRLDFAPNQAVGTQVFDAGGAGWDQRSTCFGPNVSEGAVNVADFITANPDAILMGATFNIGDTASNYVGWSGYLRGVTTAGTEYVFTPIIEAPPVPPVVPVAPVIILNDGRINRFDLAAPIAVYGYAGFGLSVFGFDANDNGFELLWVDIETINNVPAKPDQNTLIIERRANNLVIYVWRLTTGEFQFNVIQPNGKMYVMIFSVIGSNIDYTSFEYDMR